MSGTARAPELPLTEEQLQLAWRHMRKQPHWPTTLEAALAHPAIGPGVRGLARSLSRAPWPTSPKRAAPPVPPTPTQPHAKRVLPSTRFDARRAAANDRDDE